MSGSRLLKREVRMESLERRCLFDATGLDLPRFQANEVQDTSLMPAILGSGVAGVAVSQTPAFQSDSRPYNFDVDGSGDVSPLDVLVVVNAINSRSSDFGQFAIGDAAPRSSMIIDVDGDNQIGPLDVLAIVNELNRRAQQSSDLEIAVSPISSNLGDVLADLSDELAVTGDNGNGEFVFPRGCHWLHLQGGASFLAPSSVVTAGKSDGTLYLVQVDEAGIVTAAADGVPATVEIGDDSMIRIDGANTGLTVINQDGVFVMLTSDSFPEFTIALP